MTDSISKPLTEAEKLFKQLVWDPVIASGEASLFLAVPILNAPVLGTLDNAVIQEISQWLFNQFRLFMDVTAIPLLNSAHQATYDRASEELSILADEKGVDSDEYLQARDRALADLSQFTRLLS